MRPSVSHHQPRHVNARIQVYILDAAQEISVFAVLSHAEFLPS